MGRIVRDLKTVLYDSTRKTLPVIGYELLKCSIIDREIPLHYFNCLLYKKEIKNINDYISNKKMQRILQEVFCANGYENENFDNKLLFGEKLISKNISVPFTLMHNSKKRFLIGTSEKIIECVEEFISLITEEMTLKRIDTLFIKPIDGMGGERSFKISLSDLTDLRTISKVYNEIIKADFLFQESIKQHYLVNEIYSNSINTLRIHSYKDEKGNSKIASALMRLGMGGSIVDNGSSGGLYVSVNIDTWTLEGKGKVYFRNGGAMYESHPDTNFKFDGFKIPFAEDIERTVLKVCGLFPEKVIGWDIAITDKGLLVVEGNHNPHPVMAQAACGGFKNHPHFKKIFAEYI